MKSFIPLAIEALSLILLFFFGHLIEAHTKVSKSRIGLPLKVLIYPIVVVFALYFSFNEINSLTSAFLDYDLREPICKIYGSCETADNISQKDDKLVPTDPPRNTVGSMREICKLALDPDLQHWATLPEFSKSVAYAQSNGETIDTCRLKLGLNTIEMERRNREIARLNSLSNTSLCEEAYDASRGDFFTIPLKQDAVSTARSRGLTPTNCAPTPPTIDSEYQALVEQPAAAPTQPSDSHFSGPNLPTAAVVNPEVGFANLRIKPDNKSKLLMRLPEGIEVTLLGPHLSTSGDLWCKVAIGNQTSGFIYAKFLNKPCQVSVTQLRMIEEAERQQRQKELEVIGGVFGAFIQNMPRK